MEMFTDEMGCGSGELLRLPTAFLLEYMGVWNLFRWIFYVLQASSFPPGCAVHARRGGNERVTTYAFQASQV
jgi:hypothetical protein